jgi:adenylate cyclase
MYGGVDPAVRSSAPVADRALAEVLRSVVAARGDMAPVLEAILQHALTLCSARLGILFTYRASDGWRAAIKRDVPRPFADWLDGRLIEAGPGTGLGRIERHHRPLNIPDLREEEAYLHRDPLRLATTELGGARSFMAIPLLVADELLGALTIYRPEVRPFADADVAMVQHFADHTALALQNARLLHETQRLSDELAAVNRELEAKVSAQVTELEALATLRRFLPDTVAEMLLKSDGKQLLASHRQKIAALFCDLRGFTAFSEIAEPEEVIEVLETFHAVTGEIISAHSGTITDRSGDGVMVVLNDPVPVADPAGAGIRLAEELRWKVGAICRSWQARGHDLGVGIGLATGYATLGLVGSDGRYDYTAVGPTVNIASRMCDEAADGEVLITARVAADAADPPRTEAVGQRVFKGVSRPVSVLRLAGHGR